MEFFGTNVVLLEGSAKVLLVERVSQTREKKRYTKRKEFIIAYIREIITNDYKNYEDVKRELIMMSLWTLRMTRKRLTVEWLLFLNFLPLYSFF